jgi:8-oxo-dGTP pyrophosphatase MutT (NUDIX family)
MALKSKVLCDTPWLQLLELKDPENGVNSYICSHAKWTNGHGVAVLPYRAIQGIGWPGEGDVSKLDGREYLLRQEITPCWGMDPSLSSITGGMDKEGEGALQTAMRELHEEGGYKCTSERRWKDLGVCRLGKASTTVMHLFAVDLTGYERTEAPGDGTALEAMAHCEWRDDPGSAIDALVGLMCFRMSLEE